MLAIEKAKLIKKQEEKLREEIKGTGKTLTRFGNLGFAVSKK